MNFESMITVSDMSSFLFCKRKFFLNKVYEIRTKPTKREITGTIVHKLVERFSGMQDALADMITRNDDYKIILFKVHSKLEKEKEDIINGFKKKNNYVDDKLERALKNITLKESLFFAKLFNDFVSKNPIFGEELKKKIRPKIRGEENVSSEKLKIKGRVDRIIDYGNFNVAVEYKTTFKPEKIWDNQKIQVGSYILMLNEKNKTKFKKGFLIYLLDYSIVNINLDSDLDSKIRRINKEIRNVLSSRRIPKRIESNKCKSCELRNYCMKL